MSDEREETVEDALKPIARALFQDGCDCSTCGDHAGKMARLTAALAREREAVLKVAEEMEKPIFKDLSLQFQAYDFAIKSWAAALRRAVGRE